MKIIAWAKRFGRRNEAYVPKRNKSHVEQLEPRLLLSGDGLTGGLVELHQSESVIQQSLTTTKSFTSPFQNSKSYHYEKTFIDLGLGNVWTKGAVASTVGSITQLTYADTIGAGIKGIKTFDGIQKNFTVGTTGNYSITFNGHTTGRAYVVTSKFIGNAKGGWQADLEGSIVEINSNGSARDIDYAKKTVSIHSSERSILELVGDLNHVAEQIQKVQNLEDPGILSTFIDAFGDAVTPAKDWANESYSFTVSAYLEAGKTYAWQILSVSEVDSTSALVATNGTSLLFRNQVESVQIIPQFQLERPVQGNHFSIANTRWKDTNAFWADNDGIMETGEKVRLEVQLRSNANARDVYSIIRSDDIGISITEDEIDFADFSSGEAKWSEDQCKMKISGGGTRRSDFSMRIFYKVGSKEYFQDLTFDKQFYEQGEFEPSFAVESVTFDDLKDYDRKNNGDGVFQSGEQIYIRPTIKNIGTANADDVEVVLLSFNAGVRYEEQRLAYPDLLKGSSASPVSDDRFKVDADVSFSGLHWFDLRIEWADGTRYVEIPNAFSFEVEPAAWARVKDREAELGLLSKGEVVRHPMSIFNDGTKPLDVTGFLFTDEHDKPVVDTSVDKTNMIILPGQLAEVSVSIDTSNLSGSVIRKVTFVSDGRLRKPEHAVATFSGFVTEELPEIEVTGNDHVIADGDNTPLKKDHTDFESVEIGKTVTKTYTIHNRGKEVLNLTGSPYVLLYGSDEFSIVSQPNSTIAPMSSTSFQVQFSPSKEGLQTTTVIITNNDSNENPYEFVIQATGLESTLPTTLTEDFESYDADTWPESWIPDGNAKSSGNEVVTDPENASNKVLKLYGRVGSRWAAIAYHPYEFSEEYTMSLRIYNGDEVIPSYGHQGRGVVQMRHGTYWHGATNPAIRLIEFMKDGSVLAVDRSVIGQYETNQWYDLEIGFSRRADEIVVNYRLDGKSLGFVSIAVPDWIDEKPLDHVNLEASAGSAYFDDLHIRKGDFVAPEVSVDRLTTTDKTPALTGKVDDPDASVSVVVDDRIYSAVNNGDGAWILPDDVIDPSLNEGIYDVFVLASDVSRNVGIDETSGELMIQAEPQVVVDALVSRRVGRSRFNRRTGRASLEVSITNTSDKTIEGPVIVTVDESSVDSISLVNKDGVMGGGLSYIDVSDQLDDGILEPGESIKVELEIENELRKRLRPLRIGARARRTM